MKKIIQEKLDEPIANFVPFLILVTVLVVIILLLLYANRPLSLA